ncbi:hypothetical protein VKT23_006023 [Stygiomarasmius scandens]|uniref:Uncharacterized protein n=1 Tax=Marasmiellus scandens TaxID=2682957 RepID=A0ABR1JPV1_9AGAR
MDIQNTNSSTSSGDSIASRDPELVKKIHQLLPPKFKSSGLRCGRDNVSSVLPVPVIPPQYFAGAHPTMKPPLLHFGWHFEERDLEIATEKHGLLVVEKVAEREPIDEVDPEDMTPEELEEWKAELEDMETIRRIELESPRIDVHATLGNIKSHLKEKGVLVPCLTWAAVACKTGVMVSIVTNYEYKWVPITSTVQALQEILDREDKPVWDIDYWSSGWRHCPSKHKAPRRQRVPKAK